MARDSHLDRHRRPSGKPKLQAGRHLREPTTDEDLHIRRVEEKAGPGAKDKAHRRIVGRQGLHPLKRAFEATTEEGP